MTCLLAGIACWFFTLYWGSLAFGVFTLLGGWSLVDNLRLGLRRSTAFETFEKKLFLKAIGLFLGGGVGLALSWNWFASAPVLMLFALAGWLGTSWWAMSRLRRRLEPASAYKRRIGFAEQERDE